MTTVETAINLAENGYFVFPVRHGEDNTKTPLTPHGHLDASRDPGVIQEWWEKHPSAKPGVACGKSGILVVDVDTKNGKDGWTSLDEAWLDLGSPFSYETGTGGSHLVYTAPEDRHLSPSTNYRGMEGIDIRAGESWVLWAGGVISKSELAEAPEWALDEKSEWAIQGFEGTIADWYDTLVPGEPNVMVRRALTRINLDMGHSEMVASTFEAIRLGCEGATGVPELIETLEEAWMNRPAENHTTPESAWDFKFKEALLGGLEKYGDSIDLLKNLPEYSIGIVPKSIPDTLVTSPGGKSEFSKLLGLLVKETTDDNKILSVLWNCPATKDLARDWGIQFTYKRIQDARVKPEPTRENPRIEEKREVEQQGNDTELNLLTDEERAELAKRPSFVQSIESYAIDAGYDQLAYFRATSWNMLSLAMGLRGTVPVSATHRFGVNLWQIIMGYSGTGKSITDNFQTQILDLVLTDEMEVPYDLGADSSIQGLHLALLQRDGLPSLFSADEASGWFKRLKSSDWTTGMEDTLADWYMGRVSPSNKISLKDLRGKSAMTSLCMLMYATPDRLAETLTLDQFLSGFLARVMWTYGMPREETEDMFDIFKDSASEVHDASKAPQVVQEISADLIAARCQFKIAVALQPTEQARTRIAEAYKKMYKTLQREANWNILEPAVTRHAEAILKAAGLSAMYRGDDTITLWDGLHAIRQVEEWAKNLVRVAEHISVGEFQQRCSEAEAFIRQSGGSVSATKIYHRFGNWIVRDAKEIDNVLLYLVQSGIVNRDDSTGSIKYILNGDD